MKIVHVVSTPTGAPWMIALAHEQKRLGHDVAAILPSLDGGIAGELSRHGIASHAASVSLFAIPGRFARARALWELVRLLRGLRPDVVHSHIVDAVITARIASWIADVPVHLGGNVHPFSLESEVLRILETGTAFCDTKTIASCTYTRELYVRHGVPAGQVELIYYAVDQSGHDPSLVNPAAAREELGLAVDAPVIGMVAYFYPPAPNGRSLPPELSGRGIKGHDVLLRAVPHVLEEFPQARFVLVGRGWGPEGLKYEQTLKDLAASLGIAGSVLFPGERTDVAQVLSAFDVSVHCSLTDNLGGTVESLLMARPMVVSDIRGFADTVRHEETGLVVPKDDPPALAGAIIRLLHDRKLADRLGENGRAHVRAHFTLAHMTGAVEELIARTRVPHRRYRWTTTIARAVAAPFRLLPLVVKMRRALRRR